MEAITFQSATIQLPKELLDNPSLLKAVVTDSWNQMTMDQQNQYIHLLPKNSQPSALNIFNPQKESSYFKGGDPFQTFTKLTNEHYFTKVYSSHRSTNHCRNAIEN